MSCRISSCSSWYRANKAPSRRSMRSSRSSGIQLSFRAKSSMVLYFPSSWVNAGPKSTHRLCAPLARVLFSRPFGACLGTRKILGEVAFAAQCADLLSSCPTTSVPSSSGRATEPSSFSPMRTGSASPGFTGSCGRRWTRGSRAWLNWRRPLKWI